MGLTPSPSVSRSGSRGERDRQVRLALYVSVVAAAGGAAALWMLLRHPWWTAAADRPLAVAVLVAAVVVGELRTILVSRGDEEHDAITTSTSFTVALIPVAGVGFALAAILCAVLLDDVLHRRGLAKIAFNQGEYALSVLAAGLVFSWSADVPFPPEHPLLGGVVVVPVLLAGLAFVVVNHVLVAGVVALQSGLSLLQAALSDLRFSMTTQFLLVALAPLASNAADQSVLLLLLLCLPLAAVHVSAAESMRRERAAQHDSLTGLANRELLHRRMTRAIEQAPEGGPTLLLLDLDHFKDINDTLGHDVGDELLQQLAHRLEGVVPSEALVARLGGDEFAVVVPHRLAEGEALASRVLQSLQQPVPVRDLNLLVRASIGVAAAPEHGTDSSTLLKNADVALYEAKVDRGRIATYAPEQDVNSLERLQLLADLRVALDRDGLDIAFQPQVRLSDRRTVGVEALVRWGHVDRGAISPEVFVPLAENAGLIGDLTANVLDAALAALARWRREGHDVRMAVNVSARHMSDLGLPSAVTEALRRHAVPPDRLVLEVTETGILSDPARVDLVVRELRDLGVSIAVDDYGTGNASLTYLKRLDVDELKVDRSFVSTMNRDQTDFRIVRSTVNLARDLGLRVVAEGVEDETTGLALASLGCDVAQGYHLGRPVAEAALLVRLRAEQAGSAEPVRSAG